MRGRPRKQPGEDPDSVRCQSPLGSLCTETHSLAPCFKALGGLPQATSTPSAVIGTLLVLGEEGGSQKGATVPPQSHALWGARWGVSDSSSSPLPSCSPAFLGPVDAVASVLKMPEDAPSTGGVGGGVGGRRAEPVAPAMPRSWSQKARTSVTGAASASQLRGAVAGPAWGWGGSPTRLLAFPPFWLR